MPTETRYLRSDTQTVNGLTARKLGTDLVSSVLTEIYRTAVAYSSADFGVRFFRRLADGTEVEIISTGTPIIVGTRNSIGAGLQSVNISVSEITLNSTDSIIVRCYYRNPATTGTWTQSGWDTPNWITSQLNALKLNAATWTVYLYTIITPSETSGKYDIGLGFGSSDEPSRIENFTWTSAPIQISLAFRSTFNVRKIIGSFLSSAFSIKLLYVLYQYFTSLYSSLSQAIKSIISISKLRNICTSIVRVQYFIFSLVSKSVTFLYNLLIGISKIIVSKFNSRNLIAKTKSLLYPVRTLASRTFRSVFNSLILLRSRILFSFNAKVLTSRYFKLMHSLRILTSKIGSFGYAIRKMIDRIFKPVYNIQSLIRKTFASTFKTLGKVLKVFVSKSALKTITSRPIVFLFTLRSLASKIFITKFNLLSIVAKIFRFFNNIRIRVLQFLSSSYKIISISIVATILTAKYGLAGLIKKFLSSIHILSTLVKRLSSSIHSLRITIFKPFEGFYVLKVLIARSLSGLFKLKTLVTRLITSLSKIFQIVPRIVSFKYNTKVSISRILSSKFGIGAIISRILSFFYSFTGFFVVSVSADPVKVIRTGPETVRLRCDWYDEADLDSSLYECKFWVRDEMNNIYGPYIGTVVKKDSKEYYATYDLDPTETFLLGYYDIRVEVTKYG